MAALRSGLQPGSLKIPSILGVSACSSEPPESIDSLHAPGDMIFDTYSYRHS